MNWTAIKAENGKMLDAYTVYLRGCCNVMQDLQYLEELDIPSNLRLIASKLPYTLWEKWRITNQPKTTAVTEETPISSAFASASDATGARRDCPLKCFMVLCFKLSIS